MTDALAPRTKGLSEIGARQELTQLLSENTGRSRRRFELIPRWASADEAFVDAWENYAHEVLLAGNIAPLASIWYSFNFPSMKELAPLRSIWRPPAGASCGIRPRADSNFGHPIVAT